MIKWDVFWDTVIAILTQFLQAKGHPACRKLSGGVLVISLPRCRLAYGQADATATHCLLLQKNPDWFTFLVLAHLGSLEKTAIKRVCACVFLQANCSS